MCLLIVGRQSETKKESSLTEGAREFRSLFSVNSTPLFVHMQSLGQNVDLEAKILSLKPPDWDLGAKAGIWASRLGFGP